MNINKAGRNPAGTLRRVGQHVDGSIALAVCDGDRAQLYRVTVVLEGTPPSPDCDTFWIKSWGENEGVTQALVEAGAVTLTGLATPVGFGVAHQARLTSLAVRELFPIMHDRVPFALCAVYRSVLPGDTEADLSSTINAIATMYAVDASKILGRYDPTQPYARQAARRLATPCEAIVDDDDETDDDVIDETHREQFDVAYFTSAADEFMDSFVNDNEPARAADIADLVGDALASCACDVDARAGGNDAEIEVTVGAGRTARSFRIIIERF